METLNQLLIAESEKSELRVFAEQVMDRVK
jgi:hypothetical protein